jgi:VWFA-related protein
MHIGNRTRQAFNGYAGLTARGSKQSKRLCAGLLMIIILAAQAALVAARQTPTPGKPEPQNQTVRLKTDLVDIRAVVTDKQGKPVTNLNKEDFEIIESGHNQLVSFFSSEDLKAERRTAPAVNTPGKLPLPNHSTTTAPPRRTIVFFVDTIHLSQLSLLRVKEVLLKFIDERLGDGDLAAVIATGGGLGLFSQFTQDKQVLRMAVSRLAVSPAMWSGLFTPYLAARVEQEAPTDQTENVPGTGKSLSSLMGLLPPALRAAMNIVRAEENWPDDPHTFGALKAFVVNRGRQILLRESNQRRVTLITLKMIAEQLAALPGQRLIFMLSDGFTMQDDSGASDSSDLQAAVSRAARSGVVVYTIAAKGLTGASFNDASAAGKFTPDAPGFNDIPGFILAGDRELEHGMQRIAAGTGGEAFLTTNDLKGAMEKAVDANSYYYALGYYPTNLDTTNGFRNIKVRIKGHPEYSVRTQSGYLASELNKEKNVTPADPLKALIKAMGEPLARTAIHVEASADFLYLAADHAQVSLNVFVDAGKLGYKEQDNSLVTNPTMLTGVLDSGGNSMGVLQDTIQIRLSREQLARAREGMYRYTKRVILKPGLYQIRIGVHDPQTEQMGTATAWVEVPDLKSKKLILSSVMTAKSQPDDANEGMSEAVSQPDVRNGINVFRRDDVLMYHGWAYKPSVGEETASGLMIQGQVLQDDRVVLQDTWRPLSSFVLKKEPDAVEFGGRLKAANFKPGLYTLRILVKEAQSKAVLTKETSFEVIP